MELVQDNCGNLYYIPPEIGTGQDYRTMMMHFTFRPGIDPLYIRQVNLIGRLQTLHNLLKLTVLQNKSRKFNEWLFDPDHYAGRWHKKNMLRDFM